MTVKITAILFGCIRIMLNILINILNIINILTMFEMGCIFMYKTGRRDKFGDVTFLTMRIKCRKEKERKTWGK